MSSIPTLHYQYSIMNVAVLTTFTKICQALCSDHEMFLMSDFKTYALMTINASLSEAFIVIKAYTLMWLSIGTPNTTTFPFVSNGK